MAAKALRIARNLEGEETDLKFLEEAAMHHDIGVCRTAFPEIGCRGGEPYIRHGLIGREILEKEGFPRHALVCERHIGVGITVEDVISQGLPLPARDMVPFSLEERIVCFADLFYSKKPGRIGDEKSIAGIRSGLARFGEQKVKILDKWIMEFEQPD